MKHLHRILLVLLFALCCSQAIWASVQPAGGKMVVNVKTLNMRKSPNVESPIETKLHRGDVVEVISGVQEGWVQVQIDGYKYMGYVKYDYLSPYQANERSSQSSKERTWSDAISDQIL